jgi:hypothetical protein
MSQPRKVAAQGEAFFVPHLGNGEARASLEGAKKYSLSVARAPRPRRADWRLRLIAGQALCRKLTFVTANVAEFSCVKNLDREDCDKP